LREQKTRDLAFEEEVAEGREGKNAIALRHFARCITQTVAVYVEEKRWQVEEEEEREE
jgi:hypothetical protein